jgi:hypothetical protein
MGLLRSKTYAENITINGVLLGQPTIVTAAGEPFTPGASMDDLWFGWDDQRIPSGVLRDGEITPDETVES